MKIAVLLGLALVVTIYARDHTLESFSADFNQTITDEHNKTISYQGTVLSKRPNFALWHYTRPIEKKLYVYHNVLTIIEQDMEQAIIKRVNENIDIFSIIQHATPIDAHHAKAHYRDQEFLLTFNHDHQLASISYRDELDNRVNIHFSNQKNNPDLNTSLFQAVIPEAFDIIQ